MGVLLLSEKKKECKPWASSLFSDGLFDGVDRVELNGRRGTGKTVGAKLYIMQGHPAVWIVRSKVMAHELVSSFVKPADRIVLPEHKVVDDGDMPLVTIGDVPVRIVPVTAIVNLRQTGVDVHGEQPDLIINDEYIRADGRYIRNEPVLLDDLAETIGRGAVTPKIVCIGNPIDNANPYAYGWRVDMLSEGLYEYKEHKTRVVGTAACCDCFGKKVGTDAKATQWCAHLDTGGLTVCVNGNDIRVREIGVYTYVGIAQDDKAEILMRDGKYSPAMLTSSGTSLYTHLIDQHFKDRIIYDSFEAQMRLYELLRLR